VNTTHLAQIRASLWSTDVSRSKRVWAILDGARDSRIYPALNETHLNSSCLYAGNLAPELKSNAPYLVALDEYDFFTHYIIKNGWGESWGVYLRCDASLEQLRRHLRRFLTVQDERGKRLIFRYYDPRVLRVYLPTCLPAELRQVFGPIHSFLMEAEEPNALLRYRFENDQLLTSEIDLQTQSSHAAAI